MKKNTDTRAAKALQAALDNEENSYYHLILFVSGASPNSARAIADTKRMCEQQFPDRYELSIVDIYQQPGLAKLEQIIAVPTLVRKMPLPKKKLIGNMANAERILMPMHHISKSKPKP